MKFSINRENLLPHLMLVSGVVERRQTLPVLSNLLCIIGSGRITLTGTDQEVELSSSVESLTQDESGEITIPAKKLVDICRSLQVNAEIDFSVEGNRISIQSGRFKSHLSTLPAVEFPKVEMEDDKAVQVSLTGNELVGLLEKTSFAMAQQDVRYFFNGMLIEIGGSIIRTVATNGQRLATSKVDTAAGLEGTNQFIVPRKGVIELARLVKDAGESNVDLQLSANHLRVVSGESSLTTKLIDGKYPDYNRAIPENGDKLVTADRLELREALSRIAILSNEMYRNVKLHLSDGKLRLHANNPQHEEAEESVTVDYEGEELEIGFNVSYLIDVLSTLQGEKVAIVLSDSNGAAVITSPEDDLSRFVVSPMML